MASSYEKRKAEIAALRAAVEKARAECATEGAAGNHRGHPEACEGGLQDRPANPRAQHRRGTMSGVLKIGSRQLGSVHLITVDDSTLTDWLRGLEAASLSDDANDFAKTSPAKA